MEERKPPPARLPGLAAVLTPLRSFLRPGASSGRSATPTSCNVAAEPPRRRPVSIHPDRPRPSPPDCAPQSRCSHGSCLRSSSGDLAPLGLPLPAVLIPRTVVAHGSGHARQRAPPQRSGGIAPLYRMFDRALFSAPTYTCLSTEIRHRRSAARDSELPTLTRGSHFASALLMSVSGSDDVAVRISNDSPDPLWVSRRDPGIRPGVRSQRLSNRSLRTRRANTSG
jgi:hypothetical protein